MTSSGPKPQEIDDSRVERLEALRNEAAEVFEDEIIKPTSPLDPLESVAWMAGASSADDGLTRVVGLARDNGATWKEIAVALGEPADRESAHRVKNRFFKRVAHRTPD